MNDRPKVVTLDLGGHDGWTLQKADRDNTIFIRRLDDAEVERIDQAVGFCREHVISPTHRLLMSSYRVWQQTYVRVVEAKREEFVPSLTEELLGAMVGWLLIWRLVLDQAAHNLSKRFGRNSDQLARFRSATNQAYDSSQAYRIVEALRNEVQHREMPLLNVGRAQTLDKQTEQTITVISCRFPVSYLLESGKCPAKIRSEFAQASDAEFELTIILDDAMVAMNVVLFELAKIWAPEFIEHVRYLRELFHETEPVPPLLLRVTPPTAGQDSRGFNVEMKPLLDIAFMVQSAPIA